MVDLYFYGTKTFSVDFEFYIADVILHLRGFSAPDFNTQSGGALQLPFLDSERRSESIFGIQSAPRF